MKDRAAPPEDTEDTEDASQPDGRNFQIELTEKFQTQSNGFSEVAGPSIPLDSFRPQKTVDSFALWTTDCFSLGLSTHMCKEYRGAIYE